MLKKDGTYVIEFMPGSLRVTAVNSEVRHELISFIPGEEDGAARSLSVFVRKDRPRRIIVLSSRAACLMATFRLPSRDHAELLSMAEFQFTRLTPHSKKDMIVDVKLLEEDSRSHSLIVGAMMHKERLTPFFEILKRADLNPDVVTINTQRLFPLAKVIWSNGLNGDGKILGLCLNDTLSLGFFARGDLLFSREESQISDSALGAFIEYCHKEFPSLAIKEGMFLGSAEETGIARTVAGVPMNVRELSSFVRTSQEQFAFELSSFAFLDLLLVRDGESTGYDFLPESLKVKRNHMKERRFWIHGAVIAGMVLTGFLFLGLAQRHKQATEVAALQVAIEREALSVKSLEEKLKVVMSAEQRVSGRTLVFSVFAEVSRLLPKGAQLIQMNILDGVLNLQGKADDIELVRLFQNSLSSSQIFKDVRLDSIDKQSADVAQTVMFRVTMKVPK